MKRVIITGSSGSGKSTIARQIGEFTEIPVYHKDQLMWKAGWILEEKDVLEKKLDAILMEDTWLIDGSTVGRLKIEIQRADTVIYLNYSRWLCIYRVLKRYFTYRGRTRPDMKEGNQEKIDLEFLRYIWTYPKKKGKAVEAILAQYPQKQIYCFKRQKEVDLFLQTIKKEEEK